MCILAVTGHASSSPKAAPPFFARRDASASAPPCEYPSRGRVGGPPAAATDAEGGGAAGVHVQGAEGGGARALQVPRQCQGGQAAGGADDLPQGAIGDAQGPCHLGREESQGPAAMAARGGAGEALRKSGDYFGAMGFRLRSRAHGAARRRPPLAQGCGRRSRGPGSTSLTDGGAPARHARAARGRRPC
jgi:hypothetical protein